MQSGIPDWILQKKKDISRKTGAIQSRSIVQWL